MKRKRSVLGIILTVIGVVMLVHGLWPGLVVSEPKPGFGPFQQIAVGAGVVLLLVGGFLCAKAGKAEPAAAAPEPESAAPEPEPESPSTPEQPAPPAEEPPKTE